MRTIGIKARNYKCFGPSAQGLSELHPLNLVVGPNNSGKSTLLDVLSWPLSGALASEESVGQSRAIPPNARLSIERCIDPELGQTIASKMAVEWQQLGLFAIGAIYSQTWTSTDVFQPVLFNKAGSRGIDRLERLPQIHTRFREILQGYFLPGDLSRHVVRLNPDRNLIAEKFERPFVHASELSELLPSGVGYARLVFTFSLVDGRDDRLLERVLEHLNAIVGTSPPFRQISARTIAPNEWEVALRQGNDGEWIRASDLGHGIRTILIILCQLYLIPELVKDDRKPSRFAFLVEELENNLHPILFRRLLLHLLKFSRQNDALFFITSHSSAAIDLLLSQQGTQIIRVSKGEDGYTRCDTLTNRSEARHAIDDLGVKATDLLQSNGAIWIEGPSDRIYLRRWIELESEGELIENVHFSFIMYGGRVLSHFGIDEGAADDVIQLMPINRNGWIVMDSDFANEEEQQTDDLNPTKKRVREQATANGWTAWVTQHREIENYLPDSVVQHADIGIPRPTGPFDKVPHLHPRAPADKPFDKVKLAHTAAALLDETNVYERGDDLRARVRALCNAIRRWNGMEEK